VPKREGFYNLPYAFWTPQGRMLANTGSSSHSVRSTRLIHSTTLDIVPFLSLNALLLLLSTPRPVVRRVPVGLLVHVSASYPSFSRDLFLPAFFFWTETRLFHILPTHGRIPITALRRCWQPRAPT
jgi:hypothetical protein